MITIAIISTKSVHPSENLTTPIKKSYENAYARREPGEHTKMQMQAWLSQLLAEPRSHMKMYRQAWLQDTL
jgi:hypothetical protein